MNNLSQNCIIKRSNAGATAGTGTTTATNVDLGPGGFGNVMFVVPLSSVTGGGTVTLSAEGSNDLSDWDALTGSKAATAAGVLALEIVRPQYRYVRAKVVRADANSAFDCILSILTEPRDAPPEDSTFYVGAFVSPAAV